MQGFVPDPTAQHTESQSLRRWLLPVKKACIRSCRLGDGRCRDLLSLCSFTLPGRPDGQFPETGTQIRHVTFSSFKTTRIHFDVIQRNHEHQFSGTIRSVQHQTRSAMTPAAQPSDKVQNPVSSLQPQPGPTPSPPRYALDLIAVPPQRGQGAAHAPRAPGHVAYFRCTWCHCSHKPEWEEIQMLVHGRWMRASQQVPQGSQPAQAGGPCSHPAVLRTLILPGRRPTWSTRSCGAPSPALQRSPCHLHGETILEP
ncbi:uncharacterized protein LOC101026699 isoform X1 [Papio anubis]|uniref:uncharacterized protein LOC101026699 isoform X1 n=1 Tax=Papio anubis TaxID=9555 RepID=UPI0012AD9DC1|nr:uncharacterized protein LOC101026699 isoform X1 [Papio anubis]